MNQFDPGSEPARTEGCTCPKSENNNGAGVNSNYDEYVIDARCPLHGHGGGSDDTLATADGDPEAPEAYDVEELAEDVVEDTSE